MDSKTGRKDGKKDRACSDQSGDVVPEGKGAKLRITYSDARRGAHEADLTDDEAAAIVSAAHARPAARRGRRPKS
jgi:hypothetical protein